MMIMAVPGRNENRSYSSIQPTGSARELVEAPTTWGPRLHEGESSVTVGRAGRLSVHTLDERAQGMRGTVHPPSCMRRVYRPRRAFT